MIIVGCFCLIVNQDIVKLNYHKLSNKWFQYLIHKPHESAGSIGQSERHHHPFIQPLLCLKSYLPLISRLDPNLVIPTLDIQLGVTLGPIQHIKHVI